MRGRLREAELHEQEHFGELERTRRRGRELTTRELEHSGELEQAGTYCGADEGGEHTFEHEGRGVIDAGADSDARGQRETDCEELLDSLAGGVDFVAAEASVEGSAFLTEGEER